MDGFKNSVLSTCDYPGKVALALPFRGCPAMCPFCFNDGLVGEIIPSPVHDFIEEIDTCYEFIDAVLFGGGEPLFQPEEIITLSRYAKTRELNTLLQTSLIYPKGMKSILKYDTIDYVQGTINQIIDDQSRYQNNAMETIDLVNENDVFFEAKLVYIPGITVVENFVGKIKEIDFNELTLQQFQNSNTISPEYSKIPIPSREELKKVANLIPGKVFINTKEKGRELVKSR